MFGLCFGSVRCARQSDRMAGIYLGCTAVLGAIFVYLGYLYYQNAPRGGPDQLAENGNKRGNDITVESESPIVRIKISRVSRFEGDNSRCNRQKSAENFVKSKDNKETSNTTQDTSYRPLRTTRIIPVKPPRNRRKFSSESSSEQSQDATKTTSFEDKSSVARKSPGIQESGEAIAVMRQSGNLTQSSAEDGARDAQIVVTTYAEVYSRNSVTLNNGVSDSSNKTLREHDVVEMLNIAVSPLRHSFPVEYSAGLKKHRLVDASTSTKLNFNTIDNLRDISQFVSNEADLSNTVLIPADRASDAYRCSRSEILQDISEIRLETVNEKSVCDVRIGGLTINRAEMSSPLKRSFQLFRRTDTKHHSESVTASKGTSVSSVKFFEDYRGKLNNKFRRARKFPRGLWRHRSFIRE